MLHTPRPKRTALKLLCLPLCLGFAFLALLGFFTAYRTDVSPAHTAIQTLSQTHLEPGALIQGSDQPTIEPREVISQENGGSEGPLGLSTASVRAFASKARLSSSCRAVLPKMTHYCRKIEKNCRVDYEKATMDVYRMHKDFEDEYPACKTLWFAGFHMGENSQCLGEGGGYRAEYAAALASWMMHAEDVLQPVLVLAWQGVENSTDKEFLTSWAQDRGVVVINVDSFSFQDTLDAAGKTGGINGAFMRLDIPKIVEEHDLFDLPGVCSPEILYTDSDVLFLNHISHKDMQVVKQGVRRDHNTIASYGSEVPFRSAVASNTGVMIMHVDRFRAEWPKILKFAQQQEKFPGHDQYLLNDYFAQAGFRSKVVGLPTFWTYKTYWPADIGLWHEIKILHAHGPKPDSGLWNMADCDMNIRSEIDMPEIYKNLIDKGTCCNQGVAANRVRDIVRAVETDLGVCP